MNKTLAWLILAIILGVILLAFEFNPTITDEQIPHALRFIN